MELGAVEIRRRLGGRGIAEAAKHYYKVLR